MSKLINDLIYVEVVKADTFATKTALTRGVVMDLGQGSRQLYTGEWMPYAVKKGDTIYFKRSPEVVYDGESAYIRQQDIYIVEPKQ